ncbi:OmpA family protein [Leptospira ilyithenensis]|uniref:OmpA family protein n=1 Tax=Leptospira ilyithenensis TaxID=2484901 RepID=A0A4R9LKH3_9LEPT|nr:OmpA family protein [Leptospira ilyithenensis]TGN06504.1 OmpA family protein [Leptospira ilyithenensis]
MADSYYRTIKGKQYDRELLEIVEKATKRTKSPLNKNVAKNLFEAIKDGNDYTEIEKRTVKYIRENFSFSEEADEYLRTEIRKWAAKISVAVKKPSTKKTTSKKSKSSNTKSKSKIFEEEEDSISYFHSYDESEEDIAPTPEYDELIELNNYGKKQPKPYKKWILIALVVIVVLAIAYLAKTCSCASSKDTVSKQTNVTSANSHAAPKIDLNRVEVEEGKVTSQFKSRGEAIRYINDLKIRFIKQSLTLSSDAPDQIATLASVLKEYPEINVRIKGHTCFIGELDENKILSDERAKFIKDELEKSGVSSSQLDYRGFGETTNIDTNYTEAGRIQNRRVDFSVLGVDASKEKKP